MVTAVRALQSFLHFLGRTPVLLPGAGPRRWRDGLAKLAQELSAAEKACKVTPSLLS
jgi:hypothetical protein